MRLLIIDNYDSFTFNLKHICEPYVSLIDVVRNDCVDLSAGNYKLNKLNLTNCGDKALSVGEKSILMLNEITIKDSNIGIASKDSSISKLNNAYLNNMKTCVSAYNKKQEFNGGVIKFENEIICDNFVNKFEIDKFSEITKQGKFNQWVLELRRNFT